MSNGDVVDDFGWVDEFTPCFPVDGNSVQILNEPKEFYAKLKTLIGRSKHRIVLSTLYLGSGALEEQLIKCLDETLSDSGDNFKLVFLQDYSRGTRENDSTFAGLLPLMEKYKNTGKIEVYYYHTPKLRGLIKWILPSRWNEVIGVQHMKLYIFDDSVLISGAENRSVFVARKLTVTTLSAERLREEPTRRMCFRHCSAFSANLSDSYFTNRQDRYCLLEDRNLANYWTSIVSAVCSCSFQLETDGSLRLNPSCADAHPHQGSEANFCLLLQSRVTAAMSKWTRRPWSASKGDTRVYPLIQMGPIDIEQDDMVTRRILSCPNRNLRMTMASGYFNPTPQYTDLILNNGKYDMDIVAASPSANGFFQGKGISFYVPAMYTCIVSMFYDRLCRLGFAHDTTNTHHGKRTVSVYEYTRADWTYHAKGMWFADRHAAPHATFVGSTNFGHRSVHRDLEAQMFLVTTNVNLKRRLAEVIRCLSDAVQERARILDYSSLVDSATFKRVDHYVPLWVRWLTRFARNFF